MSDPVVEIHVLSAIIAPKDENGEDWDTTYLTDPLPDPLVLVSIIPENLGNPWFGQSDPIANTLTPNWAGDSPLGAVQASAILEYGLTFGVWDDDLGPINELIGTCDYQPTSIPSGDYTFAKCGNLVTDLKLRFVHK